MRLLGSAALLAAVALAGCGGGDGDSGGSGDAKDAAAIRRIIHTASETKDPDKCSELATQRFLEQIQFQKGRKALEECRKDAKNDDPADSVDISSVSVDGARGMATYVQNGGDSDGQELTIDFVKQDGQWRFDHVTDVDIDRAKFDRSMRKGLTSPPDAVTPAVASCSVKELSRVSDEKIEDALVASKPGVIIRPIAICSVANELRKSGLAASVVTCAARRSIDALSDSEIEGAITDDEQLQAGLERTLKRALSECAAGKGSSGANS
jgi:hypothetical protein